MNTFHDIEANTKTFSFEMELRAIQDTLNLVTQQASHAERYHGVRKLDPLFVEIKNLRAEIEQTGIHTSNNAEILKKISDLRARVRAQSSRTFVPATVSMVSIRKPKQFF